MRPLQEHERTAARALAKRLLDEIKQTTAGRDMTESQWAQTISNRVKKAEAMHGIPAIWLKSFMMRIQRSQE